MTDPDDFRGGRPAPSNTIPYRSVPTTTAMPSVMTIQRLMTELVEVNIAAWKALPKSVRELMLRHPHKFHLDGGEKQGSVPDILYNNVSIKFVNSVWIIDDILE